jgi:hypothetical protein
MPEHLALFVKRVRRDDARLKEISMTVTDFLAEVERKVACLESIGVSDTPVSDLKAAASA